MFQKPAFGNNTSGFGSFNTATTTSPFGGFKPTASTSAFGAPPAFGATAAAQPATGGGLFGQTNTTGGLFGGTAAPTSAPGFGATTSGFGFGASTSTAGGGLFGNNTTTGLFGNTQNASSFGAKPAGFGFGGATPSTSTGGGLFGTTPATGTGLFGQQTNNMTGGGLFANNTGAFGQQQTAPGTAHVKYNPVVGTDVVVKSGTSQNINIKHHCITCMKEYENKSLEELRLEDYTAGRKGNTSGMFGGFQQPTENKPLFGATTSFAQPATTSAPSVFGGGGLGTSAGFGQTNTFSFGGAAQNATNTTGLFGANKPAFGATPTTGTGLFGAATTQAAPSFGTTTPSFGFGATTQNQQSGGLFGAKPATTGFGAAAPTTGFGNFGTQGPLFGSKPQQSAAPAFGTTTNAFGSMAGGFGTSTSSAGGIFGANNTFGKPTAAQPAFGFNTQPAGLGGGLGTGLGATAFQSKPAAPPFGQLNTTNMFQQPQQNNTFRTGLDGGLGGGMFSNTSTLGGPSLGMGALGTNNTALNSSMLGASAAGNVHEQILTLAARPYGDSPLFKDLLPDTSTADDVLKPTNPACMKAVLDRGGGAYRVSSPPSRLKLQPRPAPLARDKKSLFDGLEESDASLEDKLSLKPSRKRLSLRPNQRGDHNGSMDQPDSTTKSVEDPAATSLGSVDKENCLERANNSNTEDMERVKRQVNFAQRNNLDVSSERNGSWLSSSKLPWSDKEKPMDGEPTPRLYPNLDKELPDNTSERRSSWLTTKPLRKPLASNPECAENSVRELGVRAAPSPAPAAAPSPAPAAAPAAAPASPSHALHKDNLDTLSVSEEENVSPCEGPPHPTGVKLTRPGYYTIPSLDEMTSFMRGDGSCVVPHLTVGRKNYGNVYYDCDIDVAGLDLDALVHFLNKEVIVYPEEAEKPPVGTALNRRAIVTLDRIWPRDKTEKRPITDPDRLMKMDYEGKLRRVCDKHDTKFIEYRPQTGSWVFRVEHFSKYGLTDSDEEDDPTPDVLKRQLVNQSLQKSAAPAQKAQAALVTSAGLGGLGGLGLGYSSMVPAEDNLYAMHQTSLNLLNGAAKAFEMDTTEDNAESQSLYQDSRAYGVKSPTSELARLEHRQSHNVQLMKASLYADTEMEDDVSVSTGDQLVPLAEAGAPLSRPARDLTPFALGESHAMDVTPPIHTDEQQMQPLIVQPHTIVLKYHRKVPPFQQTIAGRLQAACIADMSVCRARHSRLGFGPAGAMVYTTSYDSVSDLPKTTELSELGRYVSGRASNDWSESVVTRLAIAHNDPAYNIQEILSRHLETLLEWSTFSPSPDTACPQLRIKDGAADRRAVLQKHLQHAELARNHKSRFGVSGSYCYEVWKLCEALWGADLENGGIPGTDELSIVNRHKKLLEWLTDAVSDITDDELARPRPGETRDECDGHSVQVWTLVLGGRVLDACKLAGKHGDLNMAILIAQGAGDPTFRSLISRQLSIWRECGADTLMSPHRVAALQLCAGQAAPRDLLMRTDWLRALHATARYLCPQVPSLETVLRTYESFFTTADDEVDLTTLEGDEMGMKYPLPPYLDQYDVYINNSGGQRRVLDVRYELIRARALNKRPKLRPAAYTPDPLDYTLCFLLGTWFGNPSIESITGVAEQLEACGSWHLAIQALAYHPDQTARSHLIRGVVSRHVPARVGSAELAARLQLLERLRVPRNWVLQAQAHRAKYEHLPMLEAEYLVGAEQWNAAHKVLLEELLPEAVLADELQSISPLLEKLSEAARRHEVSGWETGGQALYHYLHVCDEIRGLVSSAESARDRSSVQGRLEALRPTVAAACRALGGLTTKTPRHCAARAEMGARLVQLALAAGEPPHHLASLLKALQLPPDCTAIAQHKITTDLAEQASELCIESASSSPLSSHHRATVQS